MMKRKMNLAQISRMALWLGLIVCFGLTAVRAQQPFGTVIPHVCFEAKPETFTRMMTNSTNAGSTSGNSPNINLTVPVGIYRLVFNPGGATEESLAYGRMDTSDGSLNLSGGGFPSQTFLFSHALGETILLAADGDAVYGYNNLSSTAVIIQRGISSNNFFSPGVLVYTVQPTNFLPGVHSDAFRLKAISNIDPIIWFLNGGQATTCVSAGQGCGTITYQGRLSDAGNPASGQFDLQFQAFDTETGGIVQSELIKLENVQVTNGIFTVPLFFGSTFTNNFRPRFLEIGVRAGSSTGVFTTLTPRQQLTQVPFAVNAQTAQTAFDVRLQLTAGAPPSADCNETSEYGRMKVDATNNKLWICTATGWKSTVLQ